LTLVFLILSMRLAGTLEVSSRSFLRPSWWLSAVPWRQLRVFRGVLERIVAKMVVIWLELGRERVLLWFINLSLKSPVCRLSSPPSTASREKPTRQLSTQATQTTAREDAANAGRAVNGQNGDEKSLVLILEPRRQGPCPSASAVVE
jgi:hypothetical protein